MAKRKREPVVIRIRAQGVRIDAVIDDGNDLGVVLRTVFENLSASLRSDLAVAADVDRLDPMDGMSA